MTVKQLLQEIQKDLRNNNIDAYHLEGENILSLALKKDRLFLITNSDQKLKPQEIKQVRHILKQRKNNYPLAYLQGRKHFFKYKFIVNRHTLIPRPESEIIIEEIINQAEDNEEIFIDIGTGSGCLIVSLALELGHHENKTFYALDISSSALRVAKKNAKKYQINKKIAFHKSDLLKKIIKINNKNKFLNNKKVTIMANLPYLTAEEISNSPSIQFEPKKALYGGKDGLDLYRKMLKQLKELKNKSKIKAKIYIEISPWQKDILIKEIKNIFADGAIKIKTIPDLNQRSRVIVLEV